MRVSALPSISPWHSHGDAAPLEVKGQKPLNGSPPLSSPPLTSTSSTFSSSSPAPPSALSSFSHNLLLPPPHKFLLLPTGFTARTEHHSPREEGVRYPCQSLSRGWESIREARQTEWYHHSRMYIRRWCIQITWKWVWSAIQKRDEVVNSLVDSACTYCNVHLANTVGLIH